MKPKRFSGFVSAMGLVAALCLVQGAALAFSGSGSGTQADPYVITTVDQLQEMADELTAHYVLGNDIDASATSGWNSGAGFEPVGTNADPFVGSFDGQDHTITDLFIDRPSTYYAGLFGCTGTGTESAPLSNVSLAAVDVTGADYVGALVGHARNGALSNCHVLGGTVLGGYYIGGLLGQAYAPVTDCSSGAAVSAGDTCGGLIGDAYSGDVTRCHATGDVTSTDNCVGGLIGSADYMATTDCSASGAVTSVGDQVGGLIGVMYYDCEVSRCKASGDVSGEDNVGGLVGNAGDAYYEAYLYDSYALGAVTGDYCVGGLVGSQYEGAIERCYSAGAVSGNSETGGLVADTWGDVTDSFWDVESSGQTVSDGGTGKTTAEMKQQATFDPPWDFGAVWGIIEGFCYPYLQWEEPPCEGTGPRDILAAPASVDFGDQLVNQGAGAPRTITIINMGGADLTISSVTISGDAAFAIVSDSGEATLGACTTRTVEVGFDPSTTGAVSANLVIESDDPDTPSLSLSLSGAGTNTAPVAGVYPAGSCLNFNGGGGADSVACGSGASLAITGDLTIETWVRRVQTGSWQTLACWSGSGETEAENVLYQIHLTPLGGDVAVLHENGSGVNTAHTFDTNLGQNQWYHVAVVRDATAKSYTLYVDGAYFDAWSYSDNPTGGGNGACYLGRAASDSEPLYGRLDDVRVWNTVRTGPEILAGMNREYDGDESGLAGYWKLNEGTGGTTADATANGNDGTFEGEPTWVTPSEAMGGQTTTPTRYTDEETDLVVALEGTDADGDALEAYVSQLPDAADGALYQYDGGGRGALIDAIDTLVTDPQMRVVYAPADKDAPYTATMGWRVFDGLEYSAGSATLTIEVDAQADVTPPTAVLSVLSASPTGADAVDFEVAFSEPVAPTFDASDVSLTGTLTGSVDVTGTDPTYTVTVTLDDADADGTVGIAVAGGGAVTDVAGNPYAGGSSALCEVYNWRGFTQQPQGARKYSGDSHTLTLVPDCPGCVMSHQWKWDDGVTKTVHDVGGDSPTYNIPDVTGLAGDYWCDVSYGGDVYPSATVTLEVEDHLEITEQPAGGVYTVDESHTFEVVTTGGYTPVTFIWKKGSDPVSTDPTYTIADLRVSDSGTYTVEARDDNGDLVVSAAAVLIVTTPTATPAAGLLGLGLLAAGFVVAAATTSRRRRH